MVRIATGRKLKIRRSALILGLLMLLSSIAMPASATPSEGLQFEIQVTYALGNFTTVDGDWSSEGLFASAGDAVQTAHHAGWPGNGWQFQTAHLKTTLSDGNGTITIQDQSQLQRLRRRAGADLLVLAGGCVPGGVATLHGPVSVTVAAPTSVRVGGLGAGAGGSVMLSWWPVAAAGLALAAGLVAGALRRRQRLVRGDATA